MPTPPDTFEALLHEAFRYALALTHDRGQAEELVQEACLAVMRASGPWARRYLLRAVRSRFLDHKRRENAGHYARPTENGKLDEMSRAPACRGAAGRDESTAALHAALGRLTEAEREALVLAGVFGLTARQIARHMGRPRGSVLSLLKRGRERLSRLLPHNACEVSP